MGNSAQHSTDRLAELLRARSLRIVLAESCTAGNVAAALGAIPGISDLLCGSFVVYRVKSKTEWLGIDSKLIDEHSAESSAVAASMAVQALSRTSEAHFSASVTGHLGPQAPANLDGKIFVGIARRVAEQVELAAVRDFQLAAKGRVERRREATELVVRQLDRSIRAGASC